MNKGDVKILAKILTTCCFRDKLEKFHVGKTPISKNGNFTDVKVITPDREIEWNRLSRISNEEMKELRISVEKNIYDMLLMYEVESEILIDAHKTYKKLKAKSRRAKKMLYETTKH